MNNPTFTKKDLEFIQRIFNSRCQMLQLDPSSPEAQQIASQIFELYGQGVKQEHEIIARMILPLK
ncbi:MULTISPECIES: hypothetical protein [unclassified Rhizobium]|uniref:hypothetical protein n=1 Tax=unclassified Rhizobium TaxID=2613769 RepID=UPI0007163BA8|nr:MULTISPECIES: hypothetical protein [unclassified Rhizobium]KQT01803.1 hypothetical protein ASG50_19130 [Rhizobium sp. Leaf386]KQT03239.1 hypothetical protein ASG42_24850 [Rhizobium sp. Leaf391]KQU08352.1 hypothetical protein ASG68_22435 [Rhizobium sp. Leaf453]